MINSHQLDQLDQLLRRSIASGPTDNRSSGGECKSAALGYFPIVLTPLSPGSDPNRLCGLHASSKSTDEAVILSDRYTGSLEKCLFSSQLRQLSWNNINL